MRTDQLVTLLAADAAPVRRRAVSRRLLLALAVALPVSAAWMLLAYGVRRDLIEAMFWPMFWVRLLFGAGIALAAFVVVQRLARPGVPVRGAWLGLAAPVLLIWLLAGAALLSAPQEERAALVWGHTWRSCAIDIAVVSLPMFAALLWALKGLAPTRPALAGAAAPGRWSTPSIARSWRRRTSRSGTWRASHCLSWPAPWSGPGCCAGEQAAG
jgi:hypothetical protein